MPKHQKTYSANPYDEDPNFVPEYEDDEGKESTKSKKPSQEEYYPPLRKEPKPVLSSLTENKTNVNNDNNDRISYSENPYNEDPNFDREAYEANERKNRANRNLKK